MQPIVKSKDPEIGLRRLLVFVLPRPPKPDRLPSDATWGQVVFARVVTVIAWGIAVAMVYGAMVSAIVVLRR